MNLIERINTWVRERHMRARLRPESLPSPLVAARVPYPPREMIYPGEGYVARSGPGVDMPMPGHIEPAAPSSTSLAYFGEQLGEQLALAKKIADAAAQSDIESYCPCEQLGRFGWYDTASAHPDAEIGPALRYLELRQRLVRHPMQRHLVRFPR